MKYSFNQIISCFLLLCISTTIIPLPPAQGHADNSQCDLTNLAHENNACHVSCYHVNDLNKEHCKHQAHFINERVEFRTYNYLNTQQEPYLITRFNGILHVFYSKKYQLFENFIFQDVLSTNIYSRGPPNLI